MVLTLTGRHTLAEEHAAVHDGPGVCSRGTFDDASETPARVTSRGGHGGRRAPHGAAEYGSADGGFPH